VCVGWVGSLTRLSAVVVLVAGGEKR